MVAQQASAPLLSVSDLTRTFGHGANTIDAVDRVSFCVQSGEILAIVGESGSGKTTLARLLLRLLDATSGSILLHGQDVTALRGHNALKSYWRKVQAVFQDPFAAFNQFCTIRRLLGNSLNILGRLPAKERQARSEDALCEVGLDPRDVLDKWPHQLSGGQVQRVMIARALIVGPELLVADESTSMLDASLRVTVLNVLQELRERHHMSILFITHDLGQAYYVSDRVLVMYHGQLVEQGPVEQVLLNPQHEYTKRLMSDVPLLKGREKMTSARA